MEKYNCHFAYNQEQFMHQILPRKNVVYTFVIEQPDGTITDFLSFYNLPSIILKKDSSHDHSVINVAYLYYYAVSEPNKLEHIINFGLKFAKEMIEDGT